MPIYEYKCESCGHRFDVLQSIGENGDKLSCPECGAPKPEKIFSAFASSGNSSAVGGGYAGGGGCGTGGFG